MPADPTPPSLPILGIPVAQVTYDALLRWLGRQVAARRAGPPPEGGPPSVIFANVHLLTETVLQGDYRRAVLDAALVAPDGMPLAWASRLMGSPLPDRCYGPDAMAAALDASQGAGWTHFLYGAVDPTLDALERAIARRWPGARVVGRREPPFGPLDDGVEGENIAAINESGADLVWVGMGCPKQELWMHRYRRKLRAGAVLGVGAAFDFLAGVKPQAPAWLQRHGLEWAFRLGSEPRRLWQRYALRNPLFLLLLAHQLLWQRRPPGPGAPPAP